MAQALRIGLLGHGRWGHLILRDLMGLGAEVVVIDPAPAARAAAEAAGAVATADAAERWLDRLAGWIVATPATRHRATLAQVCADGRPILCEKPLATSTADAAAIRQMLRGPLHMCDVWRHHSAVQALRDLAAGRTLGPPLGLKLTRANWTSPRTDVDCSWNLAPHDVAIFREIFGALPEPRWAFAERHGGAARMLWSQWQGPDADAPWMVSEIGNRAPCRVREIRLHCRLGVACYSEDQPDLLSLASGDADTALVPDALSTLWLPAAPTALQAQLGAWMRWLHEPAVDAPLTSLADGLATVERIAALRRLAGLEAEAGS